jgi:hypothetical protein
MQPAKDARCGLERQHQHEHQRNVSWATKRDGRASCAARAHSPMMGSRIRSAAAASATPDAERRVCIAFEAADSRDAPARMALSMATARGILSRLAVAILLQ